MSVEKFPVPREAAGDRLDRFLTRAVPGLSLDRARVLIEAGQVRIRGKQCQAARKLWGNETVELHRPDPVHVSLPPPEGFDVPVLYSDPDVVIVDKPPGIVVEPSGSLPSVSAALAAHHGPFDVDGRALPGVVHRLDRETSGCLVLARTDAARAALEQGFRDKRIDKRYLALVLGSPPKEGQLNTPYGRDPKDPRKFTTRIRSPRRALLRYRVRARFDGAALIEVELDTGRTHQVRVQLAEVGHPVIGDSIYGPRSTREHPAAIALGRHALHAITLTVPLSAGGRVCVSAPLPEDFRRALEVVGRGR